MANNTKQEPAIRDMLLNFQADLDYYGKYLQKLIDDDTKSKHPMPEYRANIIKRLINKSDDLLRETGIEICKRDKNSEKDFLETVFDYLQAHPRTVAILIKETIPYLLEKEKGKN